MLEAISLVIDNRALLKLQYLFTYRVVVNNQPLLTSSKSASITSSSLELSFAALP
jgi:hypothetical protein